MPTLDPGLLEQRVTEFLDRQRWTRQQLDAFQQDRLAAILRHAAEHSGFYRETLGPLVAQGAPLDSLSLQSAKLIWTEPIPGAPPGLLPSSPPSPSPSEAGAAAFTVIQGGKRDR